MAEGFLMYDPRLKKEVESGNPALILAHMVRNTGGVGLLTDEEEEQFWAGVAKLADWLDSTEVPRRTDQEIAQIVVDQIREGGELRRVIKE